MFGLEMLDIAIGLILVYGLLSAICSAIQEGLEAGLKMRAKDLERGVRELLPARDGGDLVAKLYQHPMIAGLYEGAFRAPERQWWRRWKRTNLPSYLPSDGFAVALMDIVARGEADSQDAPPTGTLSLESLRAGVARLQPTGVRRALETALTLAGDDLTRVQANLEAWFNQSMDRVSGWYKRRAQAVIFVTGFALVVALNANTLTILDYLSNDDVVRQMLVAEATAMAGESTAQAPDLAARVRQLRGLGLPLGWRVAARDRAQGQGAQAQDAAAGVWSGTVQAFTTLVGWLITAFAISLGAPFWFDLLNRVISLRSSLKVRESAAGNGGGGGAPDTPPRRLAFAAGPPSPPQQPADASTWANENPEIGVV